MLELKGKYNNCNVFTDNVDAETTSQLLNLLNQESIKDERIRIMPDTHAGAGCVIGTTMTIKDKVVPNLVGVDVGCFTGDTKICMSTGSWIPIKSLVGKEPFMVDSYDTETEQFVLSKAIAKKTRENANLVKVTYHNVSIFNQTNYEVFCTPDHKFLTTDRGWVDASALQVGENLVSEDHIIKVDDVEPTDRVEDVYCLTVEDTHTFLIDGSVVVHNCGMTVVKFKGDLDFVKLDEIIRRYISSGI